MLIFLSSLFAFISSFTFYSFHAHGRVVNVACIQSLAGIEDKSKSSRFAVLMENEFSEDMVYPLWNTFLYADKNFILASTKGLIVPGWLLLISKEYSLNLAQRGEFPVARASEILSQEFGYGGDFIWFEHGMVVCNSQSGCGIDHAYLYLILNPPFTLEAFYQTTTPMTTHFWRKVSTEKIYSERDGGKEHLVFGNKHKAFVTHLSNTLITQFFRRVIVELPGRHLQWDYRKFPYANHVREIIKLMNELRKNKGR